MPIYYHVAVLHLPWVGVDLRLGSSTLCTGDSLKVLGLCDLFLDCSSVDFRVCGDDSVEIRGCSLFTS